MNGKPLHDSQKLVQNGREVYKWAMQTVPQGMKALLDKAGKSVEEVDCFVPHSANLRMIESNCEKNGTPIDKTLVSVVRYGNTSAASIPLALSDAVKAGRIRRGDTLMLYGFGGGARSRRTAHSLVFRGQNRDHSSFFRFVAIASCCESLPALV